MKFIIVIALVLLTMQGKTESQTSASDSQVKNESSTNDVKETLIALEKKSWEAWKSRDGEFFRQFLSDDHVEVGVSGVANKETIVKFVSSPICVVKNYSVDQFQLTLFDAKTALLNYHAAQDTTCGGSQVPSPVWVTSLYVKRGGRWLNAVYQQTPAKD